MMRPALARVGVLTGLLVLGWPAASEACWFLRCCKRPAPAPVPCPVPVPPDDDPSPRMYESKVLKASVCRDPYVPAACDEQMDQWVRVTEREKEACVREELLGMSCGKVADPYPINDEPLYLYPARLNLTTRTWERAVRGGPIDARLPKNKLPKSQF